MKSSQNLRSLFISLLLPLIYLTGIPSTVSSQSEEKLFLPFMTSTAAAVQPNSPGSCLSPQEAELGRLINEYRASVGLPAAPFSKSLTTVAQYHVQDLQTNYPNNGSYGTDRRGLTCNMHTWSNKGFWNSVCYTGDHQYAEGMWFKPREVTRGVYTGYGFEIAAGSWGKTITAQDTLNMWKGSSGHNNVILEKDIWQGQNWPAMGIGMTSTYAVVWFSSDTDPQGSISTCR